MSIKEELNKPLDPKYVSERSQGGARLSYVEGHHVIREANRIFGHGGWNKHVSSLVKVQEEQIVNGEKKLWYVGYICTGAVTVSTRVFEDHGDSMHSETHDVGFGQGIDKDLGRAHESAVKEAVTDMMKRCLKDFGDPFGLALYDKAKEHVAKPEPKKNGKPDASAFLQKHGVTPSDKLFQDVKAKYGEGWRKGIEDYLKSTDSPTPEGLAEYIEPATAEDFQETFAENKGVGK